MTVVHIRRPMCRGQDRKRGRTKGTEVKQGQTNADIKVIDVEPVAPDVKAYEGYVSQSDLILICRRMSRRCV